jgi:short subunit dehydrogenase-like uncharacterized protein
MPARAYDIVVYGATGFTGGLLAKYLYTAAASNVKLAIAGRNADKLRKVADELAATSNGTAARSVGVLVGSAEQGNLLSITRQTRVVVSTAGPFALHGEPLVAACIEGGADYVDSTGESSWVAEMIAKYGALAKQRGLLLVSQCGFDSVPADVGTLMLVEQARKRFNVGLSRCTAYVSITGGSASGGTIASVLNMMESGGGRLSYAPIVDPATEASLEEQRRLVQFVEPRYTPFYAPAS